MCKIKKIIAGVLCAIAAGIGVIGINAQTAAAQTAAGQGATAAAGMSLEQLQQIIEMLKQQIQQIIVLLQKRIAQSPVCGNGVCETAKGETAASCAADCGQTNKGCDASCKAQGFDKGTCASWMPYEDYAKIITPEYDDCACHAGPGGGCAGVVIFCYCSKEGANSKSLPCDEMCKQAGYSSSYCTAGSCAAFEHAISEASDCHPAYETGDKHEYCCCRPCANPATDCAKEGELVSLNGEYPSLCRKCCSGLSAINHNVSGVPSDTGPCYVENKNLAICTNCGNGICGMGENKCNCPRDCGEILCAKEGERVNADVPYCCDGLSKIIDVNVSATGECGEYKKGSICTNCGNGVCEAAKGENKCNCIQDCSVSAACEHNYLVASNASDEEKK